GRDTEREGRAGALAGGHRHVAAVVRGHVADDGETETGAARLAAAGPVDSVEPLEDPVEVTRRDADAVVADLDVDPRPSGPGGNLHDRSGAGVLDAVLDEVGERRHGLTPVANRPESPRRLVDLDPDVVVVAQMADALDGLGRDEPDAHDLAVRRFAELDAGQLEQILDDA